MHNNKFLAVFIILLLGIILPLSFSSDSVSAYTASISTNNDITLDISPSGNGTTIHSESINVASDCRNGYNLTIATPESSNLYQYNNGSKVSSSASFTAVDGTSALDSSNNTNKWGYTLTSSPTSSTIFSPLSSTASTIKTSSETASPDSDINDTFNINYGIKVDNSVAPGNYQMDNHGAVVYYLTMNTTCTQYTVSFNPNGGTVVGGGNNPTQGIETGQPTKLASSDSLKAPQGASYTDANNNTINGQADKLWTFWGWNTNADGTGDWYKDRESVEDLANAGSTITLYAQWKQATLADMTAAPSTEPTDPKQISHNEMQDMRPETCYNSTAYDTSTSSPAHTPYDASTNPNGYHTITLNDFRGKVITDDPQTTEQPESYTVSKLPDNLCWMTKDLNLGRESGGVNGDGTVTLTSDDTDLADNTTFTLPVSPTAYTTGSVGYYTPQILTNHTVTQYTVNSIQYSPTTSYYSWAAATATNTSITATTNIATSICPKNWDLPNSSRYPILRTKGSITSAAIAHSEPYNFVYGGYRNAANGFYNQTSFGFYWTSTNYSSNYAYQSYTYSGGLYSATSTPYKYYGNKLRCVASNGTVTINYDGNGTTEYPVTGSTASQENVEINSANTMDNGFTRTGWAFNGWNTAADGSGSYIGANTAITYYLNPAPGSSITLYAQWIPQYTITYTNNCKSWATADANCTDSTSNTTSEQKINLVNNPSTGTETGTLGAYNKFTLTGWKIKEWTTNADGTGTTYPVSSTYTAPAGSSVGSSITLYAHWVPIYTVQYDGNGADNSSTGMGSTNATTGIKTVAHTNVGEGDTFTLFASNFKKSGYGFVGWSTDANAWSKLTDNDTTNDAKIWGPNEIITAPAYNGTPITTLYAIWAPAEKTDPSNPSSTPVYLQGWTGCSAMTATTYDTTTGKLAVAKNSITALTDERDGNVYTIAKLADENCWMVENLRLADTHEESGNTVATVLTTTNTNILVSNNTLPITNIYNSDSSLATTSNSLSPTSSASYDASSRPYGWCTDQNAACYNQSRLNTTNTVANITPSQTQNITSANAHTNFDNTIYAYGNYYNWYSATAGYGTYSRNTSTPTDGDLCPAGWHLPYGSTRTSTKGGNTSGGFYYLANRMTATASNTINSNRFRSFPNNFIFAGSWESSAFSRGGGGDYWSASGQSSASAYSLHLDNYYLSPGSMAGYKNYGYSVRCVADF